MNGNATTQQTCPCGSTVGSCGWNVRLCGQGKPTLTPCDPQVHVPTQGPQQVYSLGPLFEFSQWAILMHIGPSSFVGNPLWVAHRKPMWSSCRLANEEPITNLAFWVPLSSSPQPPGPQTGSGAWVVWYQAASLGTGVKFMVFGGFYHYLFNRFYR